MHVMCIGKSLQFNIGLHFYTNIMAEVSAEMKIKILNGKMTQCDMARRIGMSKNNMQTISNTFATTGIFKVQINSTEVKQGR